MNLQIRFRLVLVLVVLTVSLATLFLAGLTIALVRAQALTVESRLQADREVQVLARRTEQMLSAVERYLPVILQTKETEPFHLLQAMVETQPLLRALYLIDDRGQTLAVGLPRGSLATNRKDLVGIDFTYNPLYQSLPEGKPLWSDKFVSTLAGSTSLGVGYREGTRTALAELPLEALATVVELVTEPGVRVMVVDSRGELVVDTAAPQHAGITNVSNLPFVRQARVASAWSGPITFEGRQFQTAHARSSQLGWSFFVAIPAGLDNPQIRHSLADLVLLYLSFFGLALAAVPLWSRLLTERVSSLRTLADQLAEGQDPPVGPPAAILEFADLEAYLRSMGRRIREREAILVHWNQVLEERVKERTAALETTNLQLRESLEENLRMQDQLVESEKLAALGRLVAGVAHEMNTPLGNARMAVSSLEAEWRKFETALGPGLRRSDLDRFLKVTAEGLDIAAKNLVRAAGLVTGFKQVASDQTASVRRRFDLTETLSDVALTLQPMFKRTPHRLITEFYFEGELDSYPGVLGQIVTNLVSNALHHGWNEGETGLVRLISRALPSPAGQDDIPWVRITVSDDGHGVPPENRRKIFEPFFTTRLGQGGTGLGLNISYNGARTVLGGTLSLEPAEQKGATFHLDIPTKAPGGESTKAPGSTPTRDATSP